MDEDQLFEFPFLCNVGLLLTYKCTISCPHCIVQAGPDRSEEMPFASAKNWLNQISAYRNGYVLAVSLTGGEPFYNLDHLLSIANHANSLGLAISVVSNAFWATSKAEALRILNLCSAISMISISTDIPHQNSIPFSNVKNAIWAAKKLDKVYRIAITTENLNSDEYTRLLDQVLEITDMDFVNPTITLPVGRARKFRTSKNYTFSSEPPDKACSMSNFPIIMPNGDVIACIGPPITLPRFNPLFLGNLYEESLSAIFNRAENNHVLHAIRTFGPAELVTLLKENSYNHLLPEQYLSNAICDVCYHLFSNQKTSEVLTELISNNEKFRQKVEYGRYYYLNEPEMINQ